MISALAKPEHSNYNYRLLIYLVVVFLDITILYWNRLLFILGATCSSVIFYYFIRYIIINNNDFDQII